MVGPLGVLGGHGEPDCVGGSVHEAVVLLLGQFLDRGHHGESEVFCDGVEVLDAVSVEEVAVDGDRSVRDGFGFVRDDEVGVELHLNAKAVTGRACAERAVEGEHAGLKLFEGEAADRACHPCGVHRVGSCGSCCIDESVFGTFECGFDCFDQSAAVGGVEPVNDDVDVVHDVAGEFDLVVGAADLAVNPYAGESVGVEVAEELFVGSFFLADDWCKDGYHPACGELCLDCVCDLFGCAGLDLYLVFGAVGNPDSGVEETQVVVDLGDGSDG